MDKLHKLIKNGEDRLLERCIYYARERGYLKHTATSQESWRAAISGLSRSLLSALDRSDQPIEFGPEDDPERDPVLSFGMEEARRHRSRGVSIGMFLGLIKYFRQSYIDLIYESDLDRPEQDRFRMIVDRIFDRVEIGFCMEWGNSPEKKLREELQSTNRTLTAEKNKYQTLIESIPDPVILLDENFQVDKANSPAGKLFKISCSLDQESSNGLLANLINDVKEIFSSQQEALNFSRDLETSRGMRHFHVQLKRMQDISEKYRGIVVVFTDLTERKQVEDELRLFRDLIDQSSDSLMILDPEQGRFLYVNETVCQRLGYTRKELYAMQTSDIEIEAYQVRARKFLLRHLREQGVGSTEGNHRRKDGTVFPVEVSLKYVRQEKQDYIIAVARDVTEHREMEKKASGQLVFVQTLLDAIPFPVFYKDTQFRFIGCNTAYEQLVGLPKKHIIGKIAQELFSYETAQICYETDCLLFKELEIHTYENTFDDTMNPPRKLVFHKVPFFNSDGNLGGLVGVVLGTTEQRPAEHALERMGQEKEN